MGQALPPNSSSIEGQDIAETFNYEESAERRAAKGSTSKSSVIEQIVVLRKMLA